MDNITKIEEQNVIQEIPSNMEVENYEEASSSKDSQATQQTDIQEIPNKMEVEIYEKASSSKDSPATQVTHIQEMSNEMEVKNSEDGPASDDSDSSNSECEEVLIKGSYRKTIGSSSSSNEDSSEDEVELIELKTKQRSEKKKKGNATFIMPLIENLNISVKKEEALIFGKVLHKVKEEVVIKANCDVPPIDLESVLFLDSGSRAMGRVYDVFGGSSDTSYSVKFNSVEEIEAKNIIQGTLVYYAPQTKHTSFIDVGALCMQKGCDASWKNEQEPSAKNVDYSGDEEETLAKTIIKRSKLKNVPNKVPEVTYISSQQTRPFVQARRRLPNVGNTHGFGGPPAFQPNNTHISNSTTGNFGGWNQNVRPLVSQPASSMPNYFNRPPPTNPSREQNALPQNSMFSSPPPAYPPAQTSTIPPPYHFAQQSGNTAYPNTHTYPFVNNLGPAYLNMHAHTPTNLSTPMQNHPMFTMPPPSNSNSFSSLLPQNTQYNAPIPTHYPFPPTQSQNLNQVGSSCAAPQFPFFQPPPTNNYPFNRNN